MDASAEVAALDRALGAAGVDDPPALRSRLAEVWPGGIVPPAAWEALAVTADPALAVATLARLREADAETVASACADPTRAARLLALFGASPLVGRFLTAESAAREDVLAPAADAPGARPPTFAGAVTFAELAAALRRFKRRRVARIAARDLLHEASLEETTAALATLAEEALDAALVPLRAALVAQYGDVCDADGRPLGFTVLGMGKLGGRELNFSSDIDLVYLYERDGVESAGGPRGRLSARELFSRLAEDLTRALHHGTADGYVFRVDLRLRPEGGNGPIVNSLASALAYYEAWGQTWERAAYLKARPVAGDRALGETFLHDIEPFVFRRYLDYATLEDITEMKGKVEHALAMQRAKGLDVKLGRGGIREVEFVIQSLQLVNAGKDERLRERNSLTALRRLVEHRYLAPAEGAILDRAYRFLRDVEHKIQLVDERQTQVIPSGEEELRLARRLGYAREQPAQAVGRLRNDCARHMEAVHTIFARVLYEPRETMGRGVDARSLELLAGLDDAARASTQLRALGFRDVEGSLDHLRLLRDGAPTSPATPRRRKLLLAVAPALVSEIVRAPDPDLALRNLARFLAAVGARSSFLALLAENPSTLRVLVRLFGSSEYLSQVLIRHPEMLDNLVRADLVRVEIPRADLAADLASLLDAAADYEGKLEALRRFRNEQFLRIGVNDLESLLPFYVAGSQLSDVADVCLDAAWRIAEGETLRRYRLERAPGRFAIIGMGKLGARELTYNSDLDLIFVYVLAGAPEHVAVHEFFTRLAQTLLTTLQVPTREGYAYKIDTRLRPSGNAGPLVSSLEAFSRYHAESSQLWERQALIKARAVAGVPSLGREVETIVARFVYAAALRDEEVAEIDRLRRRMERELAGDERAEFNIKTGRGGLVDIEFLAQMLQLRHGTAVPSVRQRATRHALAELARAGVIDDETAAALDESYAFLRTLTNRLRIERDQPVEAIEREGERLPPLARRLGYQGTNAEVAARLLADYARHRERVRALYSRWFGAAEPRPADPEIDKAGTLR